MLNLADQVDVDQQLTELNSRLDECKAGLLQRRSHLVAQVEQMWREVDEELGLSSCESTR